MGVFGRFVNTQLRTQVNWVVILRTRNKETKERIVHDTDRKGYSKRQLYKITREGAIHQVTLVTFVPYVFRLAPTKSSS